MSKKKRTTREKAADTKKSYEALIAAMPRIGETVTEPKGLPDLARRVGEAEVLLPDLEVKVSTGGKSVFPGDMVALVREVETKGETVTLAAESTTLLAASGVGETVVILFSQGGSTYLKAAKWTGQSWTLGSTMLVLESALAQALLIPFRVDDDPGQYLAIVYPEDSSGMIQFWRIDNLDLAHKGTDIWTEEDPVNLCGDWGKRWQEYSGGAIYSYGLISLGYQGTDGSIKLVGITPIWDTNYETLSGTIYAEKTILPGEQPGVIMANGSTRAFTIPETDGQTYLSRAWTLTAFGGGVWITYPGADGKRYLLELWTLDDYKLDPANPRRYKYEPGACAALLHGGYLPCGACVGTSEPQWPSMCGCVVLGGISRLSGPNQRSSLGVEYWMGQYGNQLTPLWFGEEDQEYSTNIGLIRVCPMGEKAIAMGYNTGEGSYRVILLGQAHPGELLGGPTAEVATAVGPAAELCGSGTGVALAWQGTDGAVYLRQMEETVTAIPTRECAIAGAQAVTGGRPGQTVRVKRLL